MFPRLRLAEVLVEGIFFGFALFFHHFAYYSEDFATRKSKRTPRGIAKA
jgi:hypothetical protein